MITLLAVIHIIACLGLITLVLLQDSKGGGVFTSQATSNSVLGAGGATSLAQTMTKVIATLFAVTCVGLSILSARSEKSVIDTMPVPAATQQMPATTDTAAAAATTTAPATQEAAAPAASTAPAEKK